VPEEKGKKETGPLKVTDKRIFTSEGDLKDEFKETVKPADPSSAPPPKPPEEKPPTPEPQQNVREKAENPGTPFTRFIESLILNAYMSMGMLRNPYQPEMTVDLAAAREMIDIIVLLEEKTKGNLSPEESDFLTTHLSDLKLAFVQRSKAL